MTFWEQLKKRLGKKPSIQKEPVVEPTTDGSLIEAEISAGLKNDGMVRWKTTDQDSINEWYMQLKNFTDNENGNLVVWYSDKDHLWCCKSIPYGSISYLEFKSSVQPAEMVRMEEQLAKTEAALAALTEKDNAIIANLGRQLKKAEEELEQLRSESASKKSKEE